jgi:hypothetical protein
MSKKPLSREAIRAIAIRNKIARKAELEAAQGVLPGIVAETPAAEKPMHPRLLAMCVEAAGFENDRYADAA